MNPIGFIRAYLISISYLGLLGIVIYGIKRIRDSLRSFNPNFGADDGDIG